MIIRGLGGGDWVVGSNGGNAGRYEVSMLVKIFSLIAYEYLKSKLNSGYLKYVLKFIFIQLYEIYFWIGNLSGSVIFRSN